MPLLVAQRLAQRRTERERAILHGVVLVDVEVALAVELQRETAVLGDLLQHVIEEPEARGDAARPLARQIDSHRDLGFPGRRSILARRAAPSIRAAIDGQVALASAVRAAPAAP